MLRRPTTTASILTLATAVAGCLVPSGDGGPSRPEEIASVQQALSPTCNWTWTVRVVTPAGVGVPGAYVQASSVQQTANGSSYWGPYMLTKQTDANGYVYFYGTEFLNQTRNDCVAAVGQIQLTGMPLHYYGVFGKYWFHWDYNGNGGPWNREFTLVPESDMKAMNLQFDLLHGMGSGGTGSQTCGSNTCSGDFQYVGRELANLINNGAFPATKHVKYHTPLLAWNNSFKKYGEYPTDSDQWLGAAVRDFQSTFSDRSDNSVVLVGHSSGGRVATRMVSDAYSPYGTYYARAKAKMVIPLNSPIHGLGGNSALCNWPGDNAAELCSELWNVNLNSLGFSIWKNSTWSGGQAKYFTLWAGEHANESSECNRSILDPWTTARDDNSVYEGASHHDNENAWPWPAGTASGLYGTEFGPKTYRAPFCHGSLKEAGGNQGTDPHLTAEIIANYVMQAALRNRIGHGRYTPQYWSSKDGTWRSRYQDSYVDDTQSAACGLAITHRVTTSDGDVGYDSGCTTGGSCGQDFLNYQLIARSGTTAGVSLVSCGSNCVDVVWSGNLTDTTRDLAVRITDTFGLVSEKHVVLTHTSTCAAL